MNRRILNNKMLLCMTIFWVLFTLIEECNSIGDDCKWTADDGNSVDLSSLAGTTLSKIYSQWNFTYSPCQDSLNCDGTNYMANQMKETDNSCTAYLASWTSDVSPVNTATNTYTFTYSNGKTGCNSSDTSENRRFVAKYTCSSSTTASVNDVTQNGACEYTMTIESSLVCFSGGGGGGSSSSGSGGSDTLSLGWIIIICFGGVVFLYCTIGYIICKKKNPDNTWWNVKGNTPHLNFWCLLPKLTWAGCCVTKDFTVRMYNKVRGNAGEEGGYDSVED